MAELETLQVIEQKPSLGVQNDVTGQKDHARAQSYTSSQDKEAHVKAVEEALSEEEVEAQDGKAQGLYAKYRVFILCASIIAVLGWWISSIVVPTSRPRWITLTVLAWNLVSVIAFRFTPNSVVTRPVSAVWGPFVSRPFFSIPYRTRLAMGWLALIGIVFGSAFGFKPPPGSTYGDRAISVFGLAVFQFGFYLASNARNDIPWNTVIVGLFFQQAIALFALKTDAGFRIFKKVVGLARELLDEGAHGAQFFFDADTVAKHWFFINILSAIIFFVAFVQMLYYFGVMQWLIAGCAWFFSKSMDISGAEAVVAVSSPFFGPGESACLVQPYVDLMTPSEIHLTMTSGFSTLAGSLLTAYITLGISPRTILTSSVMSVPASIAISKLRFPEKEDPITRGNVVVDRGIQSKHEPANALHAFCNGASFGLVVAGRILTNVLTILALVYSIDGILTWLGKGFAIHHLTLELIFGYIFYPLTFLMGTPRPEILRVSRLIGKKFVANEFVAYLDLQAIQKGPHPLSLRAYTIASYALCGFGNLGSVGIQIGVLSALAPSRARVIARIAPSALFCGFIATMQTAGIAGTLA